MIILSLPVEHRVNWQELHGQRPVLQDHASGSRPPITLPRWRALAGIDATYCAVRLGNPATLFPMVEPGTGISILPALALPAVPRANHLRVKLTPPGCRASADAGAA